MEHWRKNFSKLRIYPEYERLAFTDERNVTSGATTLPMFYDTGLGNQIYHKARWDENIKDKIKDERRRTFLR